MSMVQQAIEVSAPLHAVYEQLAAFESYPRFMTGVEQVTPIGDQQTHWVMDIDGQRHEFDARITELSLDERVSWAAVGGPQLSETIMIRPIGQTRTQVVAQLEADIALLMPTDLHGAETLNRRLKHDLSTLKGLIESGRMASATDLGEASSKQLAGRSGTMGGTGRPPTSPVSVAARIRSKPQPGEGNDADRNADDAGHRAEPEKIPDVPGRRIVSRGVVSGGVAGSPAKRSGSAPMGGRTTKKDAWGDGMISEDDRGSAHDL